jgi:hypothetical protein
MSTPPRSPARLVFGVGRGIAGTVYGTVTVMATITVYGIDTHPWKLTQLVAGTVFVLWIAHVYAHGLSESIAESHHLTLPELRSIAHREAGIVYAAAAPVAVLILGGLGVFEETTAVWIALGIGFVTLGVQGARYAKVTRLGPGGRLAAIGLDLALGGLVVVLKVFLTH